MVVLRECISVHAGGKAPLQSSTWKLCGNFSSSSVNTRGAPLPHPLNNQNLTLPSASKGSVIQFGYGFWPTHAIACLPLSRGPSSSSDTGSGPPMPLLVCRFQGVRHPVRIRVLAHPCHCLSAASKGSVIQFGYGFWPTHAIACLPLLRGPSSSRLGYGFWPTHAIACLQVLDGAGCERPPRGGPGSRPQTSALSGCWWCWLT